MAALKVGDPVILQGRPPGVPDRLMGHLATVTEVFDMGPRTRVRVKLCSALGLNQYQEPSFLLARCFVKAVKSTPAKAVAGGGKRVCKTRPKLRLV